MGIFVPSDKLKARLEASSERFIRSITGLVGDFQAALAEGASNTEAKKLISEYYAIGFRQINRYLTPELKDMRHHVRGQMMSYEEMSAARKQKLDDTVSSKRALSDITESATPPGAERFPTCSDIIDEWFVDVRFHIAEKWFAKISPCIARKQEFNIVCRGNRIVDIEGIVV